MTGLIYTPAFKNPTLIGVMPGYYNSAYGITTTLAPNENLYLSYGAYDGNGVHQQTGLSNAPHFNGYYFHIAEAGCAWLLGSGNLPGGIAVGGWRQTGRLTSPANIAENGASGLYLSGRNGCGTGSPASLRAASRGFSNSASMIRARSLLI